MAYGDRPVVEITSGRAQALLAYLVLHRQAAQARQRIAFHLWPDSTDEQARANLRKELSRLRHALPQSDNYLRVDTKTLQWIANTDFILDVAEFEAAVKAAEPATDQHIIRAKLEQALEQYQGNLLPDLDDEWVLPERERLQQKQVWALERLVNLFEEQHDYQTALTYAQQLLRIDPLNETTYASLIRLHGCNGDRAKALQLYHQCMTVLREELGIEPSLSTRKLYEQLLMEETATPPSGSLSSLGSATLALPSSLPIPTPIPAPIAVSPLVGRESEWATMQQWAAILRAPSASGKATPGATTAARVKVLLLLGEPGIGKTRLLEELRGLTQTNQAHILWGTGFLAEMMRPYGIWIDALRSSNITTTSNVPAELGFLLPELGQPAPAPPDLSHLFDAVVQLLRQWAHQAPLLILLDDIQWLDEASSALLHYAMRLLRPLPVLFALAARTQELTNNSAIWRVVQALRREQQLQTLELQPLDREQTAALIRSIRETSGIASIHSPPELSLSLVNRVFIDSGGNPLFALEIARAIAQNQPTQANTVEALIQDRLLQLDDATRELLPWAAALGRSFQPSTVAQVADSPVTKVLTAIAQLEQQAIIRPSTALESGMGYDFAHDIVRQAVYQQISQPRRQLIHRQIAHQIQQNASDLDRVAGEIAHHASLGGDHALAASTALAAAQRCLKLFAYNEALDLAQRGLQHCQFLNLPTRILLQVELLRVWALTGVTGERASQLATETQQVLNQAQSLGLREAEAIALETLVILHFDGSNFIDVHQNLLRVTEVSQVVTSPATAARMLAYSGSCLAEIGRDMIRAEALLLEAQSLAARVGVEFPDIFSGLGCVHRHCGQYEQAKFHLQQAYQLTQQQQDHWRGFTYLSYLAMTELETGNPTAALPYCNEMSEVADKIQGEGSEATVAAALAALAHYQLGDPQAETRLAEAIAALQRVDAKRMLAYVLTGAATLDLSHAQLELAVERAELALHNAQIVNHPSEMALSWAILIQGLLQLGEPSRALAQFELLQQTLEGYDLSLPAQTSVERVQQQITHQPSTYQSLKSKI